MRAGRSAHGDTDDYIYRLPHELPNDVGAIARQSVSGRDGLGVAV